MGRFITWLKAVLLNFSLAIQPKFFRATYITFSHKDQEKFYTSADENFVICVVFDAEFNGVVHVLDFFCANIIKMKKNWITW